MEENAPFIKLYMSVQNDVAIEEWKHNLAYCTKMCNFRLKEKENWLRELYAHCFFFHEYCQKCDKCDQVLEKIYYDEHRK